MTTITFLANNATIGVADNLHIDANGDILFAYNEQDESWDAHELFAIKSIIPPKEKAPTKLQLAFDKVLRYQGYVWDKKHSIDANGVILKRPDGDFWFFGMEGEIMHNPNGIRIGICVDTTWQSIDTAPLDGTIVEAKWEDDETAKSHAKYIERKWFVLQGREWRLAGKPTNWRPLK